MAVTVSPVNIGVLSIVYLHKPVDQEDQAPQKTYDINDQYRTQAIAQSLDSRVTGFLLVAKKNKTDD
jgi:hypothetical protein